VLEVEAIVTQAQDAELVPQIKSRLGAILRTTSGNFLEQFDFFLFGFYASSISRAFFPSDDEVASLMLTFTTFWLGALMRPIGAVILGAYVDRIGRRRGLIVTLSIMAAGTAVIAVCPDYATIGLAAPLIVLIGRLLQGFSAGVELGGVSVYLFEIAKPGQTGFYTSFQSASQQIAILVASVIGYALSTWMPPAAIAAGGWRIPFVIGCAIIPLIFVLRRSLEETPAFLRLKHHPAFSETMASLAKNWKIVGLGMLMVAMTTVTFYFITVYTPTFGRSVLKLSEAQSLAVTMAVAISNFLWLPVGGAVSDRIGRKPVLVAIATLAVVTAYPALYWLVDGATVGKMLAVELLFSFYFGVYNGAAMAALTEVVPAAVRTTCFSLAFALAVALFGTFTPLLSTYLIATTGDRAAPGYWLMAAGLSGAIATLLIYRARGVTTVEPDGSIHRPPLTRRP
jgi:MHS family citrate/tricarballylate:H+ symporter-like MFS transporter